MRANGPLAALAKAHAADMARRQSMDHAGFFERRARTTPRLRGALKSSEISSFDLKSPATVLHDGGDGAGARFCPQIPPSPVRFLRIHRLRPAKALVATCTLFLKSSRTLLCMPVKCLFIEMRSMSVCISMILLRSVAFVQCSSMGEYAVCYVCM